MKRKTTEEFIIKAKEIHSDKYDYSKTEYKNYNTKVCIICPEHGEFWQKPSDHLAGCGCQQCSAEILKKTKEQFIQDAIKVHGDKYDYSKVEYTNSRTKICIVCPEHGDFWMLPRSHLQGQGCSKCRSKKLSLEFRNTVNQFIQDAIKVHGNKYDYSKVEYVNSKTKVCIICPKHGEFLITPNNHLRNHGCPKCNSSKGELKIEQYFINHNIKFESQKKFESCKNIRSLPFDFYLPDYNLCIEFQGKQHFEIIECFGGKNGFMTLITHDTIKREWCSKSENPNLLEIKYNDDIEKILEDYFNETRKPKI